MAFGLSFNLQVLHIQVIIKITIFVEEGCSGSTQGELLKRAKMSTAATGLVNLEDQPFKRRGKQVKNAKTLAESLIFILTRQNKLACGLIYDGIVGAL